MAVLEGKNPAERNKLIAAAVLGVIALFVLWRMFFGASSTPQRVRRTDSGTTRSSPDRASAESGRRTSSPIETDAALTLPRPVEYSLTVPAVPAARRNIFAYYTPPPAPPPTASVAQPTPSPLPSVTPPSLVLAAVSPSSAYARAGEFTLEVSGDKFTPETRVFVDGQELPTRFTGAQKLTAVVPATATAVPGARQVVVRTPDNQLFSNAMTLNVTAPPAPSYSYVGLLGGTRYNDTAVLKDQRGELHNVQRGDVVERRFRVTSISERAIDVVDTQLRLKHTLPFVEARPSGNTMSRDQAPRSSPPPRAPSRAPVPPDEDGPP